MNSDLIDDNLQDVSIDPEQLKVVVGQIKKYSMELKSAKEKADNAWLACKGSFEEQVTKDIDVKKETINQLFDRSIEDLEKYSNKLDSVSNIWKDTEIEIMSTSKNVEQILNSIKNGMNFFNNK